MLAKLAEHPGWKVFQEYIERKQQEYYLNLATKLAHQATPIDQRTIDYKRGYWHAATVLLNHPAKVLERLAAELEGEQ